MRKTLIIRYVAPFAMLLAGSVLPTRMGIAQDSTAGRKILRRTMPIYPPIARQMNLAGTVKLIAIVSPDGKVKSVEAVGGSPVLIQAAKSAIEQWKYAPASADSHEMVELHFNPDGQ